MNKKAMKQEAKIFKEKAMPVLQKLLPPPPVPHKKVDEGTVFSLFHEVIITMMARK